MIEDVRRLAVQYKDKGILLDTNLYVLLLIGASRPEFIGQHRKVKKFDHSDFEIVSTYTGNFSVWVTTPHILAEVSNHIKEEYHEIVEGANYMLKYWTLLSRESYEYAQSIFENTSFYKLGVADTASKIVASKGVVLFTDDAKLAGHARDQGVDAVNFEHIRFANPRDLEI